MRHQKKIIYANLTFLPTEDQGFVANAMDGTDQAQGVPVSFERIGDETTWGDLPFCDYYVPKALID